VIGEVDTGRALGKNKLRNQYATKQLTELLGPKRRPTARNGGRSDEQEAGRTKSTERSRDCFVESRFWAYELGRTACRDDGTLSVISLIL
jgi:hypothetical protein